MKRIDETIFFFHANSGFSRKIIPTYGGIYSFPRLQFVRAVFILSGEVFSPRENSPGRARLQPCRKNTAIPGFSRWGTFFPILWILLRARAKDALKGKGPHQFRPIAARLKPCPSTRTALTWTLLALVAGL